MTASILCTGGVGYIGSHTVIKLIENGFDVHIVDNLCNSDIEVLRRLKTLTGRDVGFTNVDIADTEGMRKVFSDHKFDAVIHFAALKAVGESVQIPLKYYDNNVGGTVKLLQVMEQFGCRTIVFSSSATVYQASVLPLTESFPLGASNPYGHTKRMMEQVLTDLAASDPRWKVELLRYFNPIGAHPSGLIGESPSGIPNNLMPYIQQVGVGRRPHLSVFGNDYSESPDGTGVRDYLHVEDLAVAHVKALQFLFTAGLTNKPDSLSVQKNCFVHNLGTGAGYSVLEMVEAFEKASGKEIPYKVIERRPGDLGKVICDPSLAFRELGWKAQYGLTEMMEHAWNWQSRNPFGYGEGE